MRKTIFTCDLCDTTIEENPGERHRPEADVTLRVGQPIIVRLDICQACETRLSVPGALREALRERCKK
jgi:hypothetical protein